MKYSMIRKFAVGALSVGFLAVAGIASAGDWPLSNLLRPLVHEGHGRIVVERRDYDDRFAYGEHYRQEIAIRHERERQWERRRERERERERAEERRRDREREERRERERYEHRHDWR